MVMNDGSVRYFTVRESARLQTFPDGYVFHGSWTETMRQLGNAVPVSLARCVAASVAECLAKAEIRKQIRLWRRGGRMTGAKIIPFNPLDKRPLGGKCRTGHASAAGRSLEGLGSFFAGLESMPFTTRGISEDMR